MEKINLQKFLGKRIARDAHQQQFDVLWTAEPCCSIKQWI